MQEILDNMLQHLLSKDMLYEPMTEISQKYPPWIEAHQQGLVGRFRFIAWVKCPYRVAGKASALGAGSDIPKSAF